MSTATFIAGGDAFRNFHRAEKRTFQINWVERLTGTEVPNGFVWYVPTGMTAIASATAFISGLWLSASATASGAPSTSASATASGVRSGSAFTQVTLSGQNNFATGTAYVISGQITTDASRLYVEVFKVHSWGGINFDS